MEEFLKDDEFAQFIINDQLVDSDMTDQQKLEHVGSSIEEFAMAMDCFKLSAGAITVQ